MKLLTNNHIYRSPIFWLLLGYYCLAFIATPSDLQFLPFKVAYWFDDSSTYVNFSSSRPLFYPLILAVVKNIFGAYEKTFIIQHLAHILACGYLWHVGNRYFQIKWAFVMVWLAIFLNPINFAYHYAILTDSLFYSALIVFSAQLIIAYHKPNQIIGLVATIIFAILLRPIGIVLLPMLVILYFSQYQDATIKLSAKNLFWVLLIIVGVMGLDKTAHHIYHHDTANQQILSIFDVAMIGKAGAIASKVETTDILPKQHPQYDLAQQFVTEARYFSAISDNFMARCFTKAGGFLEVYFQHGHFRESALDKGEIFEISDDIFKAHPWQWLNITLCHYAQGWLILPEYSVFFWQSYHQAMQTLFNNLIGNQYESLAHVYFYQIEQSLIWVAPFLLIFALMGLLSFGLIMMQFYLWVKGRKISKQLGCAMFLSFLPHGYLLAVGMFNIASQRYTVAIFPTILLAMLWLVELYYNPSRVAKARG